ncbi:protein of unknown function [Rhodovastum atsumiense]|nr:protein of unknown function [Rhodovastum atsumiense]
MLTERRTASSIPFRSHAAAGPFALLSDFILAPSPSRLTGRCHPSARPAVRLFLRGTKLARPYRSAWTGGTTVADHPLDVAPNARPIDAKSHQNTPNQG